MQRAVETILIAGAVLMLIGVGCEADETNYPCLYVQGQSFSSSNTWDYTLSFDVFDSSLYFIADDCYTTNTVEEDLDVWFDTNTALFAWSSVYTTYSNLVAVFEWKGERKELVLEKIAIKSETVSESGGAW